MRKIIFIISLLLSVLLVQAKDIPFKDGEELKFDVKYKYGLVMVKAGSIKFTNKNTTHNGRHVYKSSLDLKTNSFFDKIFKVRDSLNSYMNLDLKPVYHIRQVHEGGTHFQEELFINKHGSTYTEVRVKRQNNEEVKFDTLLSTNNAGYDLLSVLMFARTLDYSSMAPGHTFNLSTYVGKRKINIIVTYDGQSIIEKSETLKYKALKLSLDIADEVFNESKSAMEMWISDDENHIPLKLKAKLKIGAAEADLTHHKNLKHPFSAEVRIPTR